ncbi:MAG: tRNA uridine-5-carboxymethylaminomethyl(34) synthesis GTPase MnmE [Gammaproteobacteria bacterium]|nr:tRNA uridine-5-carboxymethylaminomethyl(34) synthesis GTPase MnmE [Gammaproteobacteria bacterium]
MATPPGRGAISIARLSGGGIPALCKALTGALPQPRRAELCDFRARDGAAIDRGLALYFPAPHSYTGEHALELHAHGSPVVMSMLVRRCLELGARLARPGEFSERAFLNGRLDLAQAEAVADLIASSTEAAARSAMHSLQGEFSSRVRELAGELTELRVLVEAELDFPDEDIGGGESAAQERARVEARLRGLRESFAQLRGEAARGRLLRDGLKVALTGPPNAGKSSLLNALARRPRAIVSGIPGTTRDFLEQMIDLDGMPVELTDTAGLREAADEIEAEGMRRAREAQRRADLTLLVVDDAAETPRTLAKLRKACGDGPVCLVRNKTDLSGRAPGVVNEGGKNGEDAVAVSALRGDGLEELRAVIKSRAGHRGGEDNVFIARERHLDALRRARAHLDAAARQFADGRGELLAEELGACQRVLGEITGEVSSDDLLGMIFASFCIGK